MRSVCACVAGGVWYCACGVWYCAYCAYGCVYCVVCACVERGLGLAGAAAGRAGGCVAGCADGVRVRARGLWRGAADAGVAATALVLQVGPCTVFSVSGRVQGQG